MDKITDVSLPPHIVILFHFWIVWCIIGFVLGCFLVNLGNYHDKKKKSFTETFFKALSLSPLGLLNLLGILVISTAIGAKKVSTTYKKFRKKN